MSIIRCVGKEFFSSIMNRKLFILAMVPTFLACIVAVWVALAYVSRPYGADVISTDAAQDHSDSIKTDEHHSLPTATHEVAPGSSDQVRIYLDLDMVGVRASSVAIKQGVRTALSEVNDKIDGRCVEVVVKDHRGNSVRSRRHLEEYLQDPYALAVFCGLHSPPVIDNLEFIHQEGVLLLSPWAAAGPITRYPSAENWVFRLSVDDTKAGYVISDYAVRQSGYKNPALLLEETSWGASNERTFRDALRELEIGSPAAVKWFNWGVSEGGARILLNEIVDSQADVIFLVANAPEGKTITRMMASLPPEQRLPILSHWGITGGDFPKVINAQMRQEIELSFIQTNFSFLDIKEDSFAQRVLDRARQLYPDKIRSGCDINPPAGFIHAYDLTRLLIAAVEQVGLTGDIIIDRRSVRLALENLDKPIQGLLKTYIKPFEPFSKDNPDAHEAISIEHYRMGRYNQDNCIILLPEKK